MQEGQVIPPHQYEHDVNVVLFKLDFDLSVDNKMKYQGPCTRSPVVYVNICQMYNLIFQSLLACELKQMFLKWMAQQYGYLLPSDLCGLETQSPLFKLFQIIKHYFMLSFQSDG